MRDRRSITSEPGSGQNALWDELYDADGQPRAAAANVLAALAAMSPQELRNVEDRIEATLREMGVSFGAERGKVWSRNAWTCDLLPQIFTHEEWGLVQAGFRQRIHAFESLLGDLYGEKKILRDSVLPLASVLGSPYYELPATGIGPTGGYYFHLSGMCLTRLPDGRLAVKNHYFSHASGISYMMQNRRAMVRACPEIFSLASIELIADAPLWILDMLRDLTGAFNSEPTVVLLTPGTGSAAYSEHSLLARRMGIPLVQGGDLLVLHDKVFLKTICGLQRVEVIYTRLADKWIDPLVFRSDSVLGVPGLVHCLRKGTVALVNSIGAQLADDRALLCHADRIIRYYLGEDPILPTLPTYWLGDLDVRTEVFERLDAYLIRPVYGEAVLGRSSSTRHVKQETARIIKEVMKSPQSYVAQPMAEGARTIAYRNGRPMPVTQDHIIFATRSGEQLHVTPGALTRIAPEGSLRRASELGGGSKDTWVLKSLPGSEQGAQPIPRIRDHAMPAHQITSRVAENFYWLGRYLERGYQLGYLINTVQTLETEELNSAERELYRPMWNRLLPPLEKGAASSKRSIGTWRGRHQIALDPGEPGSMRASLDAALRNASNVQDLLSVEAWSVLSRLGNSMLKRRYRENEERRRAMKLTSDAASDCIGIVPEFFGVAESSMLLDESWRFCQIGLLIERAIETASALVQTSGLFVAHLDGSRSDQSHGEIEMSALLRLLGSRDSYRRVYQMRALPAETLHVLLQHDEVPRSVSRCLDACASHLEACLSPNAGHATRSVMEIRATATRIRSINWRHFYKEDAASRADARMGHNAKMLQEILEEQFRMTLDLHEVIADAMLSHQAEIQRTFDQLF